MTDVQYLSALGTVISLLITIVGYLLHRTISSIDTGLRDLKEEVYRDRSIITKNIERLQTEIHTLNISIQSSKVSLDYIQKKVEDIQKIQETVSVILNRLVISETKLENLGKIIHVGERK